MRKLIAFISAVCFLLAAAAFPVSAYSEIYSNTCTYFSQTGDGIRRYRIEYYFNGEDHSVFGKFAVDVSAGAFDRRGETFHASIDVFVPISSENNLPQPQKIYKSLPPENSVKSFTADSDSSHCEIIGDTSEYSVQVNHANTLQCLWQIDADGDYRIVLKKCGGTASAP